MRPAASWRSGARARRMSWRLFAPWLPGLFYFRETQSIHFLPILFSPKVLREQLELREGALEVPNDDTEDKDARRPVGIAKATLVHPAESSDGETAVDIKAIAPNPVGTNKWTAGFGSDDKACGEQLGIRVRDKPLESGNRCHLLGHVQAAFELPVLLL